MTKEEKHARRVRCAQIVGATLVIGLLGIPTSQVAVGGYSDWSHDQLINSVEYKAEHGHWDLVEIPEDMQINAIHSVMLPTGDVLLIAGSGNDRQNFEAGTFESLVYSPETGKTELIETPEDLFCAGHAHLSNGNLLIAGGTQGYEILPEDLEQAGGYLTLRNESPDKEFFVPEGTEVIGGESGKSYQTDADITVPPAWKDPETFEVSPTDRNIFVESVDPGEEGVWEQNDHYVVVGFSGQDAEDLHGFAPSMGMEKKEYQGIDSAYEFNPWTREYIEVDPMHYARWYPTLTSMADGHVIALSGLDGAGQVLDGQTEVYDPETKEWTERDDLRQYFPTYPAVFQTAEEGVLFSAGPSTGWGPHDEGRDPGFWNLGDNSFTHVEGLRDPELLETGAAGWLGPVNEQQLIVVGGGGIGEDPEVTGRIDVIDLDSENPAFIPLESLPQGTRYPNLVTLPTGDVFITNGAGGYRGRGASDILKSYLLDQQEGTLTALADPLVGRNYHSTALLLPNGQILVAGSDPLFEDEEDTIPGKFEKRIEIFTPPYLFREDGEPVERPVITKAPTEISRGEPFGVTIEGSEDVQHVRLIYPGAVTHVTDTNQRLVDLDFDLTEGGVTATVPDNPALNPPAHYMLVVIDSSGVPSEAAWVQVEPVADGVVAHHH